MPTTSSTACSVLHSCHKEDLRLQARQGTARPLSPLFFGFTGNKLVRYAAIRISTMISLSNFSVTLSLVQRQLRWLSTIKSKFSSSLLLSSRLAQKQTCLSVHQQLVLLAYRFLRHSTLPSFSPFQSLQFSNELLRVDSIYILPLRLCHSNLFYSSPSSFHCSVEGRHLVTARLFSTTKPLPSSIPSKLHFLFRQLLPTAFYHG